MRLPLIIFLLLPGTILAQDIIYGTPTKLRGKVNSAAEELAPILSNDGYLLYFSRAFDPKNIGGETGGLDIWASDQRKDGSWSEPTNKLSTWNNRLSNSIIGSSKDGKIVYLLNAYDHERGISFSKMENGKWGKPEVVPIKGLAVSGFTGFYMNPTFTVLMISMSGKDSYGKEDLYVSVRDSTNNWSKPVNLGPTINSEGFEMSPFLSEDMNRLYFSSDGHGGYGNADIFVAQRLYNNWTVWSQPRNLGSSINSDKFDSYFSIYGDTISFFSSNRESGQADIYSAKVTRKVDSILYRNDELTYLPDKDVAKLAGGSFKNIMAFKGANIELTQEHKNQLTAASKIMTRQQNLYLRLDVKIEPGSRTLEENQKRLLNALRFLKTLGVEGSRVTFGSENDDGADGDSTLITIRFYR
ncbi:MAG: hypothetical protein WDO14_03045 [Bacteroidota bacterium]